MQDFFNRLAAVPLRVKVAAVAGAIFLLVGGYYYFFYSDMVEQKTQLVDAGQRLDEERKDYENRKREMEKYRQEVADLMKEQQELLRQLPSDDEIEQFIESMQAQIELTGLSKVSSFREPPQPQDIYVRMPIRMSLVGTYHQINRFVANVGDRKHVERIVNIEDLTLTPFVEGSSSNQNSLSQPQLLKASFVAATFYLTQKKGPQAAKGGGVTISSGGGK